MIARGDTPSNCTGWQNLEFDRAYTAALFAPTSAARHAAFDQMERLVHAEAPYAPLYFSNNCFLVHPSVRGWRDNSLGLIDWRDLWLEAPQR